MDVNKAAKPHQNRSLPEDDIERLAYCEVGDLSREAFQILKKEIQRRGLPDELGVVADIQAKGLSEEEQIELIRKIAMFPCPHCGRKQTYLNAFSIMIVKSYVIVTEVDKPLVIACPECISTKAKSALIKSLFWGWWGIPWGPIRTIHSIFVNLRALNAGTHNEPTNEFREFVKPRKAAIKTRIEGINDLNKLFDI